MSNVSSNPKHHSQPETAVDNRGVTWGPTAAILMSIGALLAAYFGAGLLAYILPHVLGWDADRTDFFWFKSVAGQFIFVLAAEALTVGAIILFLRHRKTTIRALGFKRKPIPKDVLQAVAGYLVYFVAMILVVSVVSALVHLNVDQKQELGFDTVIGVGDKIITFISLVVLPPLAEEILFRGFLFTGLRRKLSFVWVTLIVSVLFASLHLLESSQGILWVAGIDTLILSFVLCYLRERTGNLWAGIFVHALKNGIAFVFLYLAVIR